MTPSARERVFARSNAAGAPYLTKKALCMITHRKHPRVVGIAAAAVVGLWSTFALALPRAHPAAGAAASGQGGSGGAPAAPKAPSANAPFSPADLELLKTLHATNQVEMKVGKMARDRVAADPVKSFAQKVMADHAGEEKTLTNFLKKRGMRVSALGPVPTDIPAAHLAYKGKTGAAYDHAFAGQMAADYEKAIALVERQLKETSDDTVRALLNQSLPTLRVLLATAQVLDKED